jgi:hypothetical protein
VNRAVTLVIVSPDATPFNRVARTTD